MDSSICPSRCGPRGRRRSRSRRRGRQCRRASGWMQRRFVLFLTAAALYIPALLLADTPGVIPQLALGLATVAFLAVFARRSEVETRQIICAILVATTGEIVLSLGWGLYTYRNALIPLYVPFGHGERT